RYLYYHNSVKELEELYDSGVLLQLNLLSISGFYSKEVKKMANRLIKAEMISFIGSDCHNANQLVFLSKTLKSADMNSLETLNLLNNNI
ncbi:MAG: capsular biosynthesis protein, partial [Bacteroidetes bacterium]